MHRQKLIFGAVICFLWWISEISSSPLSEKNTTDFSKNPFTINANPDSYDNSSSKLKASTNTTPKPLQTTTAKIVKATTTTQSNNLFIPTVVPKNHKPSYQPHTELGSVEFLRSKQQKWQIPSPIQLTTPDPKDFNSTKRQIAMERIIEAGFVPSPEVGSYDNTEGFVPKIHQPKTLNFVQTLYDDHNPKPNRHDIGYNVKENKQDSENPTAPASISQYEKGSIQKLPNLKANKKFHSDGPTAKTFSSVLSYKRPPHNVRKKPPGNNRKQTNRRQGLMVEFQKDFGMLLNKYPELGDLIHGFPMVEEVMKQKLAEMFEKNDYYHKQYPEEEQQEDYDESDSNSSEGEEDEAEKEKLKFDVNQGLPLKFTNFKFPSDAHANVNIYGENPQTFEGVPYPFNGKKPSWSYKKKPEDALPSNIPAGGYYQDSKFPITDDHKPEKKPYEEENPLHLQGFEKPPMSPWKRAVHLLTAFLPVGLLISALTPSVININNTNDPLFPIRQRSADWNQPSTKLSSAVVEKLQGKFLDVESIRLMRGTSDNPVCDDWNFCELAKKGGEPEAVGIEKVFWQLAHEVPENIAEKNGMKKLFKAIKSKDCSEFVCKSNYKPNNSKGLEDDKKGKPESLMNLEVEEEKEEAKSIVEADRGRSVTKDEPTKGNEKDKINSSVFLRVV